MPPTSEKMDTAADPPPAKEDAVKEGAEGNANADDDGEVELVRYARGFSYSF